MDAPLAVPGARSAAALVAELLLAGAPVVLQGAGRVGHALLLDVRHVARDLHHAPIHQAGISFMLLCHWVWPTEHESSQEKLEGTRR